LLFCFQNFLIDFYRHFGFSRTHRSGQEKGLS
jgi:hypothetical protein